MILNESKRDELLLPYLNIYKEKTGQNVPLGKFKEMMLYKLGVQGGLQNLSKSSNYYLVGATKYYFNGDLTTNNDLSIFHEDFNDDDQWDRDICIRLNACINILRDAYIDTVGTEFEQPEDFGTLTLPRLLRKYNKKINEALGIVEEPKVKKTNKSEPEPIDFNVGNGYTFDILYSYGDATKYNRWTQPGAWCITYGTSHDNGYIRRLNIHYVIFLKNGYQEIERPRTPGPGFTQEKPHDEYGNSMIAMLQSNESWEPIYITSRWNHGAGNVYCEADHAYTLEEFTQITGVTPEDLKRIYDIWTRERFKRRPARQRTPTDPDARTRALAELRRIKYAQMRVNGGENANTVFNVEEALYGRQGVEDPETGEILYDFKNSVYVCSLKSTGDEEEEETPQNGNEKTMFLVDKGKTVFETVCRLRNAWWYNSGFISAEKYYSRQDPEDRFKMHNLVLFKKTETAPWMLYDTRRHDFVDVGGMKKFKYIPLTWGSNNSKDSQTQFYVVKQTNDKMALVKISNNMPLKLPNGEFWFSHLKCESNSRWSRNVNGRFVGTPSDTFLQISKNHEEDNSVENFFYSVKRGRFVDIPNLTNVSNDFSGCQIDIFDHINLNGITYNLFRYWSTNTQLGYHGVRCIISDDGQLQSFEGFTLFDNLYFCSEDERFLCLEPSSRYSDVKAEWYHPDEQHGGCLIYDMETKTFLQFNGNYIYCDGGRNYGKNHFAAYYKSESDYQILFRENPLQILKNPVGYPSEFEFDVANYDYYPQVVLTIYTRKNTEGVRWYSSNEDEKNLYRSITKQVNINDLVGVPLNNATAKPQQETQQINESYIRRMVSEVLKKVLKDGK